MNEAGRVAKMPDEQAYPNWLWVAALAGAAPFFACFVYEGNLLRAFVASLSVGALVATTVTLRAYRRFVTLWAVLATAAAFHCLLVISVPSADTHFAGIIFAPLVVVDVLFWQFAAVRLINLFDF